MIKNKAKWIIRRLGITILCSLLSFFLVVETQAQYSSYSSRNSGLLRSRALGGSGSDTEDIVERIMENERDQRLSPIDDRIDETEKELAAWQQFKDRLDELEDIAHQLYDPTRTPFNQMIAESSNPEAFTATANRLADVADHTIKIDQLAAADRLISNRMNVDELLPPGTFTITSGEMANTVEFEGGSIQDLEITLKNQAADVIKTFLIRVNTQTQQMSIEGQETGLENALQFSGDIAPLLAAGFFTNEIIDQEPEIKEIPINVANRENLNTPREYDFTIEGNQLVLNPLAQVEYALPEPVEINETSQLLLTAIIENTLDEEEALLTPGDLRIGTIDSVKVNEWTIHGTPLIPLLPIERDWVAEGVTPLTLVGIMDNTGTVLAIYNINDTTEEQQLSYAIGSDLPAGTVVEKLVFFNNNNDKLFKVCCVMIQQEEEMEEQLAGVPNQPNYVRQAADAKLSINGIDVEWPSNTIEELISCVTLELKNTTEREEELDVDHDYETIVEVLEEFTDRYNIVMTYIYNTTQYQPRKTPEELAEEEEEFRALPSDEQQIQKMLGEYYKGVFSGEMMVNTIKSRLRQSMMNPYPTRLEEELAFLIQCGWNNPTYRDASNSINENLEGGYLELDTQILRNNLSAHFEAVKELFYSDDPEDDDQVFDNGCAYSVATLTGEFTALRSRNTYGTTSFGPIAMKMEVLRTRVENLYELREKAEEDLEMRSEEIRREMYQIEQQQRYMQQQLQELERFNMQNQPQGQQ